MCRLQGETLWEVEGSNTTLQPFYGSLDYVRDNLDEPLPEGTFCHLLDFLVQNEDNTGRCTNNLEFWMDCHPIQTNWCPHLYHPHLPDTTLPIYPGLGQAPNMLSCVPDGLVEGSKRCICPS